MALALATVAGPLAAQSRWDVGGFGGFSFPTQTAADLYKAGYTIGGTARYHNENWPFAVQVDGQWMTYAREPTNPYDGGLDMAGLTLLAVFALYPDVSPVVPYLGVGVGGYYLDAPYARQLPDSLVFGSTVAPGLVLGGGFEYRTWTSRIVPYIDVRMIGLLGSDPRETANINVILGLKYVVGGKKPR
jgi:hypothetical protein